MTCFWSVHSRVILAILRSPSVKTDSEERGCAAGVALLLFALVLDTSTPIVRVLQQLRESQGLQKRWGPQGLQGRDADNTQRTWSVRTCFGFDGSI